MTRHLYVTTRWSGSQGWFYFVCDCELIEGGHTDHREIAGGGGFTSERAARTAGSEHLAAIEAEAEEPIPCPQCSGSGASDGAACTNCDGRGALHPTTGEPIETTPLQ